MARPQRHLRPECRRLASRGSPILELLDLDIQILTRKLAPIIRNLLLLPLFVLRLPSGVLDGSEALSFFAFGFPYFAELMLPLLVVRLAPVLAPTLSDAVLY